MFPVVVFMIIATKQYQSDVFSHVLTLLICIRIARSKVFLFNFCVAIITLFKGYP